jgi:succinate dehydrogenase / fumarate reductase cytochrome b subunit
MSTASHSTTASRSGTFLRGRVASLLAIAPLGMWTVNHLWNNLSAFQNADAWENAVTTYAHPFAQLFTGIMVLVPLVLHTVWGIGRLFSSRANVRAYPMWENVKYVVQRLSAIGVLFFLGAHIFKAMIEPRLKTGQGERFTDIAWHMRHHTPTLVVYLLGTLAVAYHLANGIATFALGWGLVSTKAALRRAEWLNWTVFAILLAMSWGSIYALWIAGA